jgi:hypothetical protein
LAHAEQGFLLAEIDLHVPAGDIGFDKDLRVKTFIRANEKGGLAIKQFGALAQAVSEGGDDDQLQDLVSAGGAPHQAGAALITELMGDAVMEPGEGFPGRVVGADLLGGGRGGSVAKAAAACFLGGGIRAEEQMSVLAEAADGGGGVREMLEYGAVSVASIEGQQEGAARGVGLGVEGGAQLPDLFAGALTEAGSTNLGAIGLLLAGAGLLSRFGRSGGMAKGDRDEAAGTVIGGEGERSLQEALGAHEVGLKVRSEGIAPPSHAGGVQAGAAQEGIIEEGAHGGLGRQSGEHGATRHGEEGLGGKTVVGKEPVTGGPVTELRAAGSQQTGHGMTSQTEQSAQREGLGVRREATLVEAGSALAPELLEVGEDTGGVFFSRGAGGVVRRKASRLLSSTNHSTISPRENSMAWARAEGKLMYHCSLAWRWMSCTLVGKPIRKPPFVSSHITRYQKGDFSASKKCGETLV